MHQVDPSSNSSANTKNLLGLKLLSICIASFTMSLTVGMFLHVSDNLRISSLVQPRELNSNASAYEQQLQNAQTEIEQLKNEIEQARQDLNLSKTEVKQLQTQQKDLQQKVNHFQAQVDNLSRQNLTFRNCLQTIAPIAERMEILPSPDGGGIPSWLTNRGKELFELYDASQEFSSMWNSDIGECDRARQSIRNLDERPTQWASDEHLMRYSPLMPSGQSSRWSSSNQCYAMPCSRNL